MMHSKEFLSGVLVTSALTACSIAETETMPKTEAKVEVIVETTVPNIGSILMESTVTTTTVEQAVETIPNTTLAPSTTAPEQTTTTTTILPSEEVGITAPVASEKPEFEPATHIGSIRIEKLGVEHKLVTGAGESSFDQGFGLHDELAYPGISSDKNLIIGAHRKTYVDGRPALYDVTQLSIGDKIEITLLDGTYRLYEVSGSPFIGEAGSMELYNFLSTDADDISQSVTDLEQGFLYSCSYVELGDLSVVQSTPEGGWNKNWRIFIPFVEVAS